MTRRLTIQGEISRYTWGNPHIWVYVRVTDASGAVVEWPLEGPPVLVMVQRGLRKSDLQVGDRVEVVLYPHRDGKPTGGLVSIRQLATGRFMGIGPEYGETQAGR